MPLNWVGHYLGPLGGCKPQDFLITTSCIGNPLKEFGEISLWQSLFLSRPISTSKAAGIQADSAVLFLEECMVGTFGIYMMTVVTACGKSSAQPVGRPLCIILIAGPWGPLGLGAKEKGTAVADITPCSRHVLPSYGHTNGPHLVLPLKTPSVPCLTSPYRGRNVGPSMG